jgi:TolA-binding protein
VSRRAALLSSLAVLALAGAPAHAQPGAGPAAGPVAQPAAPAPSPSTRPGTGPGGVGGPGAAGPGMVGPGGPDVPMRRVPPPPAADRMPLAPEERGVLAEVESDFVRYREAADVHHQRMRGLIVRSLQRRSAKLERRFSINRRKSLKTRDRRRQDAVDLLEGFVDKHPDHGQFTPDALFRLADIHLDQSDEAIEAIELQNDADVDPVADYSKSLGLWQQILDRFPAYRQLPGTIYLLAHYGKYQDERRSLKLFLSLVCANQHSHRDPAPPVPSRTEAARRSRSREVRDPYAGCTPMEGADPALVQHAWVRGVADHHFDVTGELDDAIAAYRKVADATDGPGAELYAEALYKLAWSYYRRDLPIEAIKRFDRSVALYDAVKARGETPKLELRTEALQYLAVSFTDVWQGDKDVDPALALARAQEYYRDRNIEPHVRDVWAALGRAFMEIEAYDQAIVAFRSAISRPWHLHPDNPVVHMEIVNAHEAKGDKLGADVAAGDLATRYAPGTEWYAANNKNREAMDNQRRIGERTMYVAARNLHAAATEARQKYQQAGVGDPVARAAYLDLYAKAVRVYEGFVTQYPKSRQLYEMSFAMAEALYFSERYVEAAERYRWVRDAEGSRKYFQEAAYSVIQALEAEAARQLAGGYIREIRVPTIDELRALPQPITPQPMPDIHRALQIAWDEYQTLVTDPATAPQMGLNAGMVSMSYYQLDDAVQRFEAVMQRFCGTPEAARAKDGLLAIYDARGQHDAFKATNDRFISEKCGDQESLAIAAAQNRSIEFRKGAHLMSEKRYSDAAEQFYSYYKTAPADDEDRATALYNAAIAFRQADKPKTAIYLLREFTRSTDVVFRKSPYYLEALRLTALAHQGVLSYDEAVNTYLALYEEARTAQTRGLTPPPPLPGEQPKTFEQIKLDALFNAAVLRELDRDFRAAIPLYEKYEAEEPERRRKDRAAWAIARIHRSSGKLAPMIGAYERWRKLYGEDPGNEDDYVFSFYDVAKAFDKQKRDSQGVPYCQQAIAAWESRGATKGTAGAEFAGECALAVVEKAYRERFLPYRIRSQARTENQAKVQREELDKLTKEIQDQYLALGRFGVGEYAMAAKVRYGETLTVYAQKIFEMPTPKYIEDLERKSPGAGVVAKFQEALTQKLAPLAEDAKREWADVVQMGKQQGVNNRWTRLALENLSSEFPDEYPILHDALVGGTEAP